MHYLNSMGYQVPEYMEFLIILGPLILVLVVLALVLKAYAVWNAAKRGELVWFVALLFINTMGILELIYIFGFMKKTPKQVMDDLKTKKSKEEQEHKALPSSENPSA
jgi:hypothetical protein